MSALEKLKQKLDESANLHEEAKALYQQAIEETKKNTEALWDVHDVARFLKCAESTVKQAYLNGKLPYRRTVGGIRFDPETIRNHAV